MSKQYSDSNRTLTSEKVSHSKQTYSDKMKSLGGLLPFPGSASKPLTHYIIISNASLYLNILTQYTDKEEANKRFMNEIKIKSEQAEREKKSCRPIRKRRQKKPFTGISKERKYATLKERTRNRTLNEAIAVLEKTLSWTEGENRSKQNIISKAILTIRNHNPECLDTKTRSTESSAVNNAQHNESYYFNASPEYSEVKPSEDIQNIKTEAIASRAACLHGNKPYPAMDLGSIDNKHGDVNAFDLYYIPPPLEDNSGSVDSLQSIELQPLYF